ncbi:hypothetical protein ALC53_08919 [Atta colombica]|uniref:SAP domain-containing protein n=1 Tax=Atta colombica TaxID=520822 RepID=A0A151I1N5_9HYME|nr:hypothetical protein ALC53_08919 [Atta colombica]
MCARKREKIPTGNTSFILTLKQEMYSESLTFIIFYYNKLSYISTKCCSLMVTDSDCIILPTNMRAQSGSDASDDDDDATRKKTPNRTNRRQLRDFSDYDFDDASDKFREKLEYATTFSIGDLTSMCNILGLDYIGAKEELQRRVI